MPAPQSSRRGDKNFSLLTILMMVVTDCIRHLDKHLVFNKNILRGLARALHVHHRELLRQLPDRVVDGGADAAVSTAAADGAQ